MNINLSGFSMTMRTALMTIALLPGLSACSSGSTEPLLGAGGTFILNLHVEGADVEVNGVAAGPLIGRGYSFQPAPGLKVPRRKFPAADGVAAFNFGDNPIVVRWESVIGRAVIRIPPDLSLTDDAVLYVGPGSPWLLMDAIGRVIGVIEAKIERSEIHPFDPGVS
jgi:hypothetical protein